MDIRQADTQSRCAPLHSIPWAGRQTVTAGSTCWTPSGPTPSGFRLLPMSDPWQTNTRSLPAFPPGKPPMGQHKIAPAYSLWRTFGRLTPSRRDLPCATAVGLTGSFPFWNPGGPKPGCARLLPVLYPQQADTQSCWVPPYSGLSTGRHRSCQAPPHTGPPAG